MSLCLSLFLVCMSVCCVTKWPSHLPAPVCGTVVHCTHLISWNEAHYIIMIIIIMYVCIWWFIYFVYSERLLCEQVNEQNIELLTNIFETYDCRELRSSCLLFICTAFRSLNENGDTHSLYMFVKIMLIIRQYLHYRHADEVASIYMEVLVGNWSCWILCCVQRLHSYSGFVLQLSV